MPLINRIIPFFLALFIFAFLVFGFVLLSYLILFSAMIGVIVFAINWIRARLAPPPVKKTEQPQGRIIDSDDWRKL